MLFALFENMHDYITAIFHGFSCDKKQELITVSRLINETMLDARNRTC